jgi:sulfite exporter TauE/SafE
LAAFVVALLGGVHCLGMCGGIVGALTLGLPAEARQHFRTMLPYLLAYNCGRILSYTLAGAAAGGIGAVAMHLGAVNRVQLVLQVLAGVFMLLLGMYIGGWWRGLARVEQAGGWLVWRHLQPLGRKLLPVASLQRALQLGLLWGWLPCGLVYSVLIWSVSAGSAISGAMLMLSFGLGTLPTLLAMGSAATLLARWVKRPLVRHLAGSLIVLIGVGHAVVALRSLL